MHTRKQRILFIKYVNNILDSPHINLFLREELKGQDVTFKKYYTNLDPEPHDVEEAVDILSWYLTTTGYTNKYLEAFFSDVLSKPSELDMERLNVHLRLLGLPELDDPSTRR